MPTTVGPGGRITWSPTSGQSWGSNRPACDVTGGAIAAPAGGRGTSHSASSCNRSPATAAGAAGRPGPPPLGPSSSAPERSKPCHLSALLGGIHSHSRSRSRVEGDGRSGRIRCDIILGHPAARGSKPHARVLRGFGCDTRLLQLSGQERPRAVPRSVPDPCVSGWQRAGAKPGVMSKADPSHPDEPG